MGTKTVSCSIQVNLKLPKLLTSTALTETEDNHIIYTFVSRDYLSLEIILL